MIHVCDGIIYEVAIPPEEASRRIADLIRALWPAYLELKAQQVADPIPPHQDPPDRIS